jgi:hypothetical protein
MKSAAFGMRRLNGKEGDQNQSVYVGGCESGHVAHKWPFYVDTPRIRASRLRKLC